MRKDIRDNEFRLAFLFTDFNGNLCTVFFYNYTVKCKRNCNPLILFNSAVIMGFEKSNFIALVKRVGFKVKTGGVNMGRRNLNAFIDALFTYNSKDYCFITVYVIKLIPCFVFFTRNEFLEALFFCLRKNNLSCFSFSFCLV